MACRSTLLDKVNQTVTLSLLITRFYHRLWDIGCSNRMRSRCRQTPIYTESQKCLPVSGFCSGGGVKHACVVDGEPKCRHLIFANDNDSKVDVEPEVLTGTFSSCA